jgi:hypothetical protein
MLRAVLRTMQSMEANKSASGPVKRDNVSNIIQLMAMKTRAEKRDFGKNSTQCVL